MHRPRILIQLDTDPQASVFDAVVAVDSQVDHLLQHHGVDTSNVTSLVHGAMFTRGPEELKNTAIFIGGSNVTAGEQLLKTIKSTFFGPVRVSVMLDSNGANTTAAAAVLCAGRHIPLAGQRAVVLGGTGPVGLRVAQLLARQDAEVWLASRQHSKATQACRSIESLLPADCKGKVHPMSSQDAHDLQPNMNSATLVFACGAAGVTLLSEQQLSQAAKLRVVIDLNAVPPAGIHGIDPMDKAKQRSSRIDYGAIGVGGLKMKIHRASIAALFQRNDLVLDAAEIFEIGRQLEQKSE
ncbi:MAG: bifunctional NADP-dependent methylenetetrahydromethanopterin dehydrogenase/methylenetetrahydrofolate dehydrogenase [Pirellulaceae bacterium]|nr:bifunctional NADP-dependent methylenetetrahydromethanopterin dehydrogenase/methylenetetrahydrofolate dehydrogenase [Pirellulaceae bacterium]